MKPIRITTWMFSALLAAGLTFAQTETRSSDPASDTGSPSTLICKQKRSGGKGGAGQGKGDRIRKRDGSGDGCQNELLAKGQQKRGGARDGSGGGKGQGGDRIRKRDGSGDGCQSELLAKGGAGKGKGDRVRKRDGSCGMIA